MVLMLEASRLARNNSDWHRLIEICGISGTLIADESAVYNPREPNDRSGYLLDSGSPYRLWLLFRLGFGVKNSIQGDGLNCDGLLHEPEEKLAPAL